MYYSASNDIRLAYISDMAVSCKRLKLITLRKHLHSPRDFVGVRVTHLFSFLFCVGVFVCILLFFVLCRLFAQKLPMSLDCQFLLCPSVFSGVYIYDDLGYEPFLQNYIIHSTMFESKWLNICLYIGSELEFNVLHLLISQIQRFIHSGKHMLDGILSKNGRLDN
jgi:hypothetical protein